MRNDLKNKYFRWMCNLVCNNKYTKVSFNKLLHRLHEIEFFYILPMDGNRYEDGTDLRYRFGYECGIQPAEVAACLDVYPCSVLEMMIALSVRCEENIMDNPEVGDRTGQWFWGMIVSLGLGSMTDGRFDDDYVDEAIDKFLNREYGPNGEGGLFRIKNPKQDMRDVDIWYQMNWYLDEFID